MNNTGDVITGLTTLKASDYTLWWPAGMGAQNLYNVTVDVVSGSGENDHLGDQETGVPDDCPQHGRSHGRRAGSGDSAG